jgi:hypothetical protein
VRDGTHSATILLLGNYSLASFNLGPEAGGGTGTVVTDQPVTGSNAGTATSSGRGLALAATVILRPDLAMA